MQIRIHNKNRTAREIMWSQYLQLEHLLKIMNSEKAYFILLYT